jgi:hypothetical protein
VQNVESQMMVLWLLLALAVVTFVGQLRKPRDRSPQGELNRQLSAGKITASEYRSRMAVLNSRSGKPVKVGR